MKRFLGVQSSIWFAIGKENFSNLVANRLATIAAYCLLKKKLCINVQGHWTHNLTFSEFIDPTLLICISG